MWFLPQAREVDLDGAASPTLAPQARHGWFVTIDGIQHNLGPDKKEAFDQFDSLMSQPRPAGTQSLSFAALADRFLERVQRKRSADTYEWYR